MSPSLMFRRNLLPTCSGCKVLVWIGSSRIRFSTGIPQISSGTVSSSTVIDGLFTNFPVSSGKWRHVISVLVTQRAPPPSTHSHVSWLVHTIKYCGTYSRIPATVVNESMVCVPTILKCCYPIIPSPRAGRGGGIIGVLRSYVISVISWTN